MADTVVPCIVDVVVFVLVTVGVVKLVRVFSRMEERRRRQPFLDALASIKVNQPTRADLFDGGQRGLAIDLASQRVCLYERDARSTVWPFSQIVRCEILVTRRVTEHTGGTLAGHAVGTMVGGFWGGVVGGMLTSGPSVTEHISLRITSRGPKPLVRTMAFSDRGSATAWHTIVNHVIEKIDWQRKLEDMARAQTSARTGENRIGFRCKHCNREFKIAAKHAGKKGKCPTCGKLVIVPMPRQSQPIQPAGTLANTGISGFCFLCTRPMDGTPCKHMSGRRVCDQCAKLLEKSSI